MRVPKNKRLWVIVGAGGVLLALAAWWSIWLALAIVVAAVASGVAARRYRLVRRGGKDAPKHRDTLSTVREAAASRISVDPTDTKGLVEEMLAQGRYALLLRKQVVGNLNSEQFSRAREALSECMALVPEGEVVLGPIDQALDDGKLDDEEIALHEGRVVRVAALFLDRYPVTNRQFQEFVDGGGYEQMSIWDPHIWPAVLDFVDTTGSHGPRFWRHGRFERGQEHFPVIGISWYEAAAYARWAGKRLSTDAEWVKAGSWPVPLSPTSRIQRKYPWGDAMDRARCNLWGSGPGSVVAVTEYPQGASVGGIRQLIGNVWEWTSTNFGAGALHGGDFSLPVPMKSLRGGAFDTYFENQASCHFQSGEKPVARKHNVGFRCAVSMCDLVLSLDGPTSADGAAAAKPRPEKEEVAA